MANISLNVGATSVNASLMTPTNIKDGSVTTDKLADGAVTTEKLNSAVRGQISDLESALESVSDMSTSELLNGVAWEIGSLNTSNGSNLPSTTRIRTVSYIDIRYAGQLTFTIGTGYKYVVDWYKSDYTFNKVGIATQWQTTSQTVAIPADTAYMRLIISKNPDATLTDTSASSQLSCVGLSSKLVSEVQKLINDKPNALRANITRVSSPSLLSDLDDAVPNVIYNISTVLHNIAHVPSGIPSNIVNATMWTIAGEISATTNWRVQFISSGAQQPELYFRMRMNNSWRAWQKLAIDANNANIANLNYYNSTCVNKLETRGLDSSYTVLCFGDSITAGNTDTSWTYHFANMTGCTIINKAVAGSTYGESTSDKWISTQINGVSAAEWSNADLVIVSAGTNDGVHDTPDDELKTKVQSAITSIKAETDAPIVLITPIRRNTPSYSENVKLPYIAGIITNVAVANECNVICGFDFPIASETNGEITNLTRDGLHPNATGANVFARSVINALL